MKHGLSSTCAVVDDHPVAFPVEPLVPGDFFRDQEQMPDELFVALGHAVNIGDVLFGNDERMDGGLRVHVLEGRSERIFIYDFCRDLFFDDPAEEAVWIKAHDFFISPASEKLLKKQQREPV